MRAVRPSPTLGTAREAHYSVPEHAFEYDRDRITR
jgi:hypothetical protein